MCGLRFQSDKFLHSIFYITSLNKAMFNQTAVQVLDRTMQVSEAKWTDLEKKIARTAFDKAYKQEVEVLLQQVREQAGTIAELEDLWRLHDFLSAKRHEIEGKYDYCYSTLIFIFAGLEGLDQDKIAKVAALARM
jgi:predicted phosphohydrolase